MSWCRHLCAWALLFLVSAVGATPASAAPRPEPTPAPSVEVGRTPAPIHVDGKLDDEAWALLEPFTDFVQRDPDEGMPATESTELLLAYDDEALYVGVRLHDSEPDLDRARGCRGATTGPRPIASPSISILAATAGRGCASR